MENERREKVFDALNDIDSLEGELQDLVHLLCLLDEGLTDDLEPIMKGEECGAAYFKSRWPLHLSTINVIRYRMYHIMDDLQKNIRQGFEAIDLRA